MILEFLLLNVAVSLSQSDCSAKNCPNGYLDVFTCECKCFEGFKGENCSINFCDSLPEDPPECDKSFCFDNELKAFCPKTCNCNSEEYQSTSLQTPTTSNSCKALICFNSGKFDFELCKCSCSFGYSGADCSIVPDCSRLPEDPPECDKSFCVINELKAFCPKTCNCNSEEYQSTSLQTPTTVKIANNTENVISFFESNGWFILIGCIAVYYLYSRFRPKFSNFSSSFGSKKNEEEELEKSMKIAEARRRQQEAFESAKQKYLEEKKNKEEQLAQKKIEEWEKQKQGLSSKSKNSKDSKDLSSLGLGSSNFQKKPRLKNDDFNPLMGSNSSGGSCSFRPGRRPGPRSG